MIKNITHIKKSSENNNFLPSQKNKKTLRGDIAHLGYRPDIDGLRAMAVLSVVLFHTFTSWTEAGHFGQGGFIGVDIFFVISGFLISTIILNSFKNNSFNFILIYKISNIRIKFFNILFIFKKYFNFLLLKYLILGKR
jgi:hypothetical protein